MKLLGRVLIILTVAMLVVGATVAAAGSSGTAQSNGGYSGERSFGPDGDRAAGAGSGLAGLFGIVKNLVVIAVITAVVVIPQRLRNQRAPAQVMAGR